MMVHYFVWNGSPDLLSLGPITIRWYGALFACGFVIGLKILNWIAKQEKLKVESFDSILMYVILGTIIGARLGHTLIYEPEIYLADPIRILKIWEGGLASHGGTLGVVIAVYLWKRKHFDGTMLQLLDALCIPAALISAMIRIGNFFNSEIVGHPTDVPWAIVFKRLDSLPRHPTMLYECIAYLITFFTVLFIFRKKIHRKYGQGFLLGIFFIMLFGFRFLIEFIKEYQVASESQLPLDLGQLLSVPFIATGIYLVFRSTSSSAKSLALAREKKR